METTRAGRDRYHCWYEWCSVTRALYSRPKLLVRDEATSALDAETERIITETLGSLTGHVTLIVIAHRLATVRHCDQVIHLSGGRITGRGTFEQVRAQVPEFNRQAELLGFREVGWPTNWLPNQHGISMYAGSKEQLVGKSGPMGSRAPPLSQGRIHQG